MAKTEDLDHLETLAREATSGPWSSTSCAVWRDPMKGHEHAPVLVAADLPATDARYIAAASPDVVLALLARLRDAERERDEARAALAREQERSAFLDSEVLRLQEALVWGDGDE